MNEEQLGHGAAPHFTESDYNRAEHKSRIVTEQMARITTEQMARITTEQMARITNPR